MKPFVFIHTKPFAVIIFIMSVLYISCSNPPAAHTTGTPPAQPLKAAAHQKPPASFLDTVVINFPAAVFYSPDALQLEKIKAVNDPKVFESSVHENFYQVRNSKNVLKKYYPQVTIKEVTNARYLLFKKISGEKSCIDLNAMNDAAGLFAFDGKKNARLLDMTNIDSELGFYFIK